MGVVLEYEYVEVESEVGQLDLEEGGVVIEEETGQGLVTHHLPHRLHA